MTSARASWLFRVLAILIVVVVAGSWLYRAWRGPVVPAYQVNSQPLVQSVVVTGRAYAPSRARVGAEITGVVEARPAQQGQAVTANEVLLQLRADTYHARVQEATAALAQLATTTRPQAQANLEQAERQLAQVQREAERRRGLAASRAISREALEQAQQAVVIARSAAEQARLTVASLEPGQAQEAILRERLAAAQADLLKTTVRSPFSGMVLSHQVEVGDVVQPGEVLFEIARHDNIEVQLPLDEKNLALVALGQPAWCVAEAYPNQVFTATVGFIGPSVDPQRGTVEVRLHVAEPVNFLVPDMTISATIQTGRSERARIVPDDALLDVVNNTARVLIAKDGRIESRDITLGLRGAAMSEVTSGVQDGELVLRDTTLEPGSRVRVTTSAASLPRQQGNVGEVLSGL